MTKSIKPERLTIHDYAVWLKLAGRTLDEAITQVERQAIRDNVRLVYVQTAVVLKVYLDESICRRKSRLAGTQHHTITEWENKKKQYDNRCAYCGRKNKKLTKDHVLPVTLGGTDRIDNIVPACWPCNYRKRARKIEYFKEGAMLRLL